MQYLYIFYTLKIHIGGQSRRAVGRSKPKDGEAGDRNRRPGSPPGENRAEGDDPKYVSLRIPKSEYEKLKSLRGEMEGKPKYSWVGSLALGAFVGLAVGLALEQLTKSDEDGDV